MTDPTPTTPPPLTTPEISRMRLAYMAVAMRDPNPVHVDDEFAKDIGLPSVIAHGTFAVSYVGAAVSRHVGVDNLRRLKVDLTAPVFPGSVLTTEVTVRGTEGDLVVADVRAVGADGTEVARGEVAWVAGS
ncbi:MAG TPA: MaoC family dehydratase [Acidimicrobiales bacterium]|nr:MaoC family dehydratase [Acidimicrobiales bacterium]